ncbi:hypothetical protein CP969_27515 [Streptomyces viridosporus T7A]|uniref:WXG100 family type VII secretion target n=2 Tax=Streptomyces viridosporus TaxID=67581 RepID=A0ABX6ALX5_STRVD|nr:hypothetical protein CP969_27515 [Streptomyces viridosporus T7A]
MPTYHEIMTTDLATLTTAADAWDDMAKEFNKQEKAYKRDVHGVSMGQTWLGLSADAANRRFDITLKEYQSAQIEAKAIASLLRDAHTQFVDLRGKLKAARQGAVDAGLKVSDQGVVSYDTTQLDEGTRNAYRHDPDFQESVRKSIRSWQDRIDQLVKDVTDADKGVEIAFKAVVVDSDLLDGTSNGFNGRAQGDIEKYEAENAEDIATRLVDGKKVSAAELAELDRAFRDNSDSKVFSQALLKGLGPDGTIKLTNELNQLAYDDDKKNKAQYLELQGGLADTIAKATQVPGSVTDAPPGSQKFKDWLASDDGRFYRQWMDSLDKHGTKNYGAGDHPLYGYQSFVSLMQHSSVKYDDQFLYELGDDLIAAEKEQSNIFAPWGASHDGVRADALDGLLGIMSKNPDAATAFFDPAGNGSGSDHVGNSHLKYLLNEREWPQISVPASVTVITTDDPFSRMGLGAALEAAATGHPPLRTGEDPWPDMKHTEAQARVMNSIIKELAPVVDTDEGIHANLRQPLANALGEYGSDTHNILVGVDIDYISAAGGNGYFTEDSSTHLATDAKSLVQVLRGLSEDPAAYSTLEKAELRHISNVLGTMPEGAAHGDIDEKLENLGSGLGTYSAIKEDVINDKRMDKYSEADWKMKAAYHFIGGALTPLYVTTGPVTIAYGDALQRGVDTLTWDLGNSMKADADAEANAQIADTYLNANQQAAYIVDGWAQGRSDIEADSPESQALTTNMLQGRSRGAETAGKYLTDTTN